MLDPTPTEPSVNIHFTGFSTFLIVVKPILKTSAVPSPPCFVSLAFQFSFLASDQGLNGPPKFLDASLCTCHSLLTPEILHILTKTDASVLTSVYVKTLVDLDFHFEAVPALRGCEPPAACTILCVRFTHFVHLWKFALATIFDSAMGATLDTGGWLALSRQGLSPCKMHQASTWRSNVAHNWVL